MNTMIRRLPRGIREKLINDRIVKDNIDMRMPLHALIYYGMPNIEKCVMASSGLLNAFKISEESAKELLFNNHPYTKIAKSWRLFTHY